MILFAPNQNDVDTHAQHEGRGAQFYEIYRKAAEDYDKEFLKKREDLDTTPILVSSPWRPEERVLVKPPGWTVLRRFWVYYSSQLSPQA